MEIMFWVWLGVIVLTSAIEFATMEIVSIWFTVGALIPFILAAIGGVHWAVQIAVFVGVSSVLMLSLRSVTKKFLLRNSNQKTNIDALVGQKHKMLTRTDFETVGSVKINGVVWSAIGENQQKIEEGEIVEILRIEGNKIIVKLVQNDEMNADSSKVADTAEQDPMMEVAAKTVKKNTANKNVANKNAAKKSDDMTVTQPENEKVVKTDKRVKNKK